MASAEEDEKELVSQQKVLSEENYEKWG